MLILWINAINGSFMIELFLIGYDLLSEDEKRTDY